MEKVRAKDLRGKGVIVRTVDVWGERGRDPGEGTSARNRMKYVATSEKHAFQIALLGQTEAQVTGALNVICQL